MTRSQFDRAVPGDRIGAQIYAPAHAAATASEYLVSFVAPFDCRLKAVYFVPKDDVTGVDTNTTHLNVINKGSAGAGSTELGALDLTDGNDLTAFDVNTVVSSLTTDLTEDDVIAVQYEKVGTGLDVPAGTWIFEIDGG